MFKKTKPQKFDIYEVLGIIPHCDGRILHAPGECKFCDAHPEWQALRQLWGIAFTGFEPESKELPCPADYTRGNNHRLWQGNVAIKEDNGGSNKSSKV